MEFDTGAYSLFSPFSKYQLTLFVLTFVLELISLPSSMTALPLFPC